MRWITLTQIDQSLYLEQEKEKELKREDHLRLVLAEIQSSRASKTELQRVLREKAKKEVEIRKAHKVHEREEKERLKLEKKVKKAAEAANRKERGILRQNLRGQQPKVMDELEEEQLEIDIGTTLEAYDHLVHQLYVDPDTDELLEVVNVFSDKGTFTSTARVVDKIEDDIRRRKINGVDGTMELCNLVMTGRKYKTDVIWPTSDSAWMEEQLKDKWCLAMMDKLKELDLHQPVTTNPADPDRADFYFRTNIDGKPGMLVRRTHMLTEQSHYETKVTIVRQIDQIMVPKTLRASCLFLLHDQVGHPGRKRTTQTIRKNYQWIGLTEDVGACAYSEL